MLIEEMKKKRMKIVRRNNVLLKMK